MSWSWILHLLPHLPSSNFHILVEARDSILKIKLFQFNHFTRCFQNSGSHADGTGSSGNKPCWCAQEELQCRSSSQLRSFKYENHPLKNNSSGFSFMKNIFYSHWLFDATPNILDLDLRKSAKVHPIERPKCDFTFQPLDSTESVFSINILIVFWIKIEQSLKFFKLSFQYISSLRHWAPA